MTRCFPVMAIAGSDSSGGAGIAADIKTIAALGGYASAVVTAVTAQNTMGVMAVEAVSPSMVGAQIDAVMADLAPRAVKVGMLGGAATVETVARHLGLWPSVPTVVDPVMASSSGRVLTTAEAVARLRQRLLPLATLFTPNLPEAARLTGRAVDTVQQQCDAALALLDMGCGAVLLKGGHAPHGRLMTDWLYAREADGTVVAHPLAHPFVASRNTHGTGCTLSSAIATHLAMGHGLREAVALAIDYLHRALAAARHIDLGQGHGPLNHGFAPRPLATESGD